MIATAPLRILRLGKVIMYKCCHADKSLQKATKDKRFELVICNANSNHELGIVLGDCSEGDRGRDWSEFTRF